MEKNINFNENFITRRKKEYKDINTKRKNKRMKFRGTDLEDIIYRLFRLFSVVDWEDISESKNTGLLKIRNRSTGEVVGAMYNREYTDLSPQDIQDCIFQFQSKPDMNSYDIEVILKKDSIDSIMPLIDAINEYCGGVDIVVEPENMPDCKILIWGSGGQYFNDLLNRLLEEYGIKSNFIFASSEEIVHNNQHKLKKIMNTSQNNQDETNK